MSAMTALRALIVVPLLAGCGAALVDTPDYGAPIPNPTPYQPPSGTGTASESYRALYNETADLRARYPFGAARTRAADLPSSGTALYQGTSTIRVPTADNLSLLGQASILANFNRDTISGTMGNFVSVRSGQTQADSWNGNIAITSQQNQGINVSRSDYLRGTVDGLLYSGGNTLDVNGTISGNFHDDRYLAGTGLSASMVNGGTIIHNGTTYTVGRDVGGRGAAGMTIVAEN